jgi:hypothetical protein
MAQRVPVQNISYTVRLPDCTTSVFNVYINTVQYCTRYTC